MSKIFQHVISIKFMKQFTLFDSCKIFDLQWLCCTGMYFIAPLPWDLPHLKGSAALGQWPLNWMVQAQCSSVTDLVKNNGQGEIHFFWYGGYYQLYDVGLDTQSLMSPSFLICKMMYLYSMIYLFSNHANSEIHDSKNAYLEPGYTRTYPSFPLTQYLKRSLLLTTEKIARCPVYHSHTFLPPTVWTFL